MKVCIVCYGLRNSNTRLQPWRYILEIASGLIKNGIDTFIITDGSSPECTINNIRVLQVKSLHGIPFVQNRPAINIIKRERAEIALWSIGPIDYLFMTTFKHAGIPVVGLITGPLYKLSDITRIGLVDVFRNINDLSTLICYSLIPSYFTKHMVNSKYIKKVFVMSQKNQNVLRAWGINNSKIIHVPVGIEENDLLVPADHMSIIDKYRLPQNTLNLLYLGSPASIRGLDTLIKAVSKVKRDVPNVNLVILSRRHNNELNSEEQKIKKLVSELNMGQSIQIITGYLDKDEIKKFIVWSDMVALPFKIVPSDVPTSILEAMALGKPVISTNIDGIPELLRDGRGIIVEPNDEADLVKKIVHCVKSNGSIQGMCDKSAVYMRSYPRWSNVIKLVINEIGEIYN